MNWKVGQTVVLAMNNFRRYGHGQAFTIQSVGRKWVTLNNGGRFDKDTGHVAGGNMGVIGKAYPSRAAWEEELDRQAAWKRLREIAGGYSPPKGLHRSRIWAAIEILEGIER